jgi:hypothetical protein
MRATCYFYNIDSPLREFVTAHGNLVRHCVTIHEAVMKETQPAGWVHRTEWPGEPRPSAPRRHQDLPPLTSTTTPVRSNPG